MVNGLMHVGDFMAVNIAFLKPKALQTIMQIKLKNMKHTGRR